MMPAPKQYVTNEPQLSTQGQMTQLCELTDWSREFPAKNLHHLGIVLGAPDIQEHLLRVLAVLFVRFSMPTVPDVETLFSQVSLFISACDGEHTQYLLNWSPRFNPRSFKLSQ
uniref:COP9 signalosome complex subunit 3 N-terminal helical repeats domain-containing protein n=1 Tax=Theropithecus gelada TaxID=9565 RepID=A0A8D2GB42_THEGE